MHKSGSLDWNNNKEWIENCGMSKNPTELFCYIKKIIKILIKLNKLFRKFTLQIN